GGTTTGRATLSPLPAGGSPSPRSCRSPPCPPRSSRVRSARARPSAGSMRPSGATRPRTRASAACSSASTRPRRAAPQRSTWCARANKPVGPLTATGWSRKGGAREPNADLHLVRRADRPGDQPPEVDLVDLLGLRQVRPRAQGLRLQLQVDHASLGGFGGTSLVVGVRWPFRDKDAGRPNSG